jgi:hypothetical protein
LPFKFNLQRYNEEKKKSYEAAQQGYKSKREKLEGEVGLCTS